MAKSSEAHTIANVEISNELNVTNENPRIVPTIAEMVRSIGNKTEAQAFFINTKKIKDNVVQEINTGKITESELCKPNNAKGKSKKIPRAENPERLPAKRNLGKSNNTNNTSQGQRGKKFFSANRMPSISEIDKICVNNSCQPAKNHPLKRAKRNTKIKRKRNNASPIFGQ